VISSVILCFLSHFVRRRRQGAGRRGAGHRRMRPSPAGRCGMEEAETPAGEVMGGGGRGRSPMVERH
jgi:hypothetical protein